jgi:hypothetical protein
VFKSPNAEIARRALGECVEGRAILTAAASVLGLSYDLKACDTQSASGATNPNEANNPFKLMPPFETNPFCEGKLP